MNDIDKNNNRNSIVNFFKTIFTNSQGQIYHPLFKEEKLIRDFKKQIKLFELSFRNFEITYISRIKELF